MRTRPHAGFAGWIDLDAVGDAAGRTRAPMRPARPRALPRAGAVVGAVCLGLLQAPALAAPQDPPKGAPESAPKIATQAAPKTALQTAPLPPRKPQARAAAPLPPVRAPSGKATPLPPDRPAEIEEAREAEADAQPAREAPAYIAARPATAGPAPRRPSGKATPLPPDRPAEIEEARAAEADAQPAQEAPVRLAARPATPEPAARRPSGKAMPLPPARPAEIEDAREAEAQDAAQQGAAPQQAQPAPLRLATRTTAPDTAPAPAVPGAEAPGHEPGTLPAACAALVEDGAIRAELDKSISGKGSCGLAEPVRLTAVRLADGTMVPLKPASVSNCAIAAATAAWVREDLAPAAAAQGAPVTAVRIAASYDCRPRNRIPGARMSEHGLGNAVDVGGFELADGRVLAVAQGGLPPRLRAIMKESACRRFTTVLGPGSDGYHEDHIHVDLAQRRLDIRLCRWNLDAGTAVATRKDKPAAGKPAPAKPAGDAAQPPETEATTDGGDGQPAAGSGSQKP